LTKIKIKIFCYEGSSRPEVNKAGLIMLFPARFFSIFVQYATTTSAANHSSLYTLWQPMGDRLTTSKHDLTNQIIVNSKAARLFGRFSAHMQLLYSKPDHITTNPANQKKWCTLM
jgi:hypothetical protein